MFSIFKNKLEKKVSKTATLVAIGRGGQAQWTPRTYETLAKEGYQKNPVVYRCVKLIADSAASVDWLMYNKDQEINTHPILDRLKNPNPMEAGASLFATLYTHLLLSGNAYLERVESLELHALRPDRMKVIAGVNGWPEAYQYTVQGHTLKFPVFENGKSDILHLKTFHPTNDYYGQSCCEAAQTALDIFNATLTWNKALLDNAARPSGALVYAPAQGQGLTEEQYERLKEELENSFQGSQNAGRPLLLEGGLDWKSLSFSPKDMDFLEAKNAAARDIALAFGVPPMLLGIKGDNTYANYAEANKAFWRQTVLPLVQRTAQALTLWLCENEEHISFDKDSIEALSSDREALWNRISAAPFLTDDEKRIALGYGTIA